jgi:hypothetical protein
MFIQHLDGADVLVVDAQGRCVPAVDEVRVESDRAVVAVRQGAHAFIWALVHERSQEDTWSCTIRSRDGQLVHWAGPARLACA